MKTKTVNFYSEGSRVEGDLYLPEDYKEGEKRPAVVVCIGFGGTRDMVIPDTAIAFAEAGYVALTIDYRGWGGSEGTKWRIAPLDQIEDIRSAVTFLETREEVDSERIAFWGLSFAGSHAAYVAAVDKRIKVSIGLVGYGDGETWVKSLRNYAEMQELYEKLDSDRKERVLTGKGERVSPLELALRDPESLAKMPGYYEACPQIRSDMSWEAIDKILEYKPIEVVDRIAPRALLLIGCEKDTVAPIDGFRTLYEQAKQPKKLVTFPVGHFEMIENPEYWTEVKKISVDYCNQFFN